MKSEEHLQGPLIKKDFDGEGYVEKKPAPKKEAPWTLPVGVFNEAREFKLTNLQMQHNCFMNAVL